MGAIFGSKVDVYKVVYTYTYLRLHSVDTSVKLLTFVIIHFKGDINIHSRIIHNGYIQYATNKLNVTARSTKLRMHSTDNE